MNTQSIAKRSKEAAYLYIATFKLTSVEKNIVADFAQKGIVVIDGFDCIFLAPTTGKRKSGFNVCRLRKAN